MFTGLVETKGSLERRTVAASDARLLIRGTFDREPLVLGESIAVDGVCLTVAKILEPGPGICSFEADASAETLSLTTLGELRAGTPVNLERAMPMGGRMGGHVVSGHVDGMGRIKERTFPSGSKGGIKTSFELPRDLARFVALKGSICVNGVSLTVNHVDSDSFDVVLVPHTRDKTSLGELPIGTRVNLEVDLLARYVARLLDFHPSQGAASSDAAWTERLKLAGYL